MKRIFPAYLLKSGSADESVERAGRLVEKLAGARTSCCIKAVPGYVIFIALPIAIESIQAEIYYCNATCERAHVMCTTLVPPGVLIPTTPPQLGVHHVAPRRGACRVGQSPPRVAVTRRSRHVRASQLCTALQLTRVMPPVSGYAQWLLGWVGGETQKQRWKKHEKTWQTVTHLWTVVRSDQSSRSQDVSPQQDAVAQSLSLAAKSRMLLKKFISCNRTRHSRP